MFARLRSVLVSRNIIHSIPPRRSFSTMEEKTDEREFFDKLQNVTVSTVAGEQVVISDFWKEQRIVLRLFRRLG